MRFKRPGDVLERSSKKARTEPTMVVYRGIKPEMKHAALTISHNTVIASTRDITAIGVGTNVAQRVGAKIKVFNIEYLLTSASSFRATLLMPNDANASPALSFDTPVERTKDAVLKDTFAHSGSNPDCRGMLGRHKLPLGTVCRYGGPLGTDINDNAIYLTITQPAVGTVTGYVRIWYTDA